MAAIAVPFPNALPPGYEYLDESFRFDPKRHLQIEAPKSVQYLHEFGYDAEEIETKATPFAVSEAFRVLSEEGADLLLKAARSLRKHAVSCERIDTMVRSGCYRSRFLRDLCLSEEVTDFMSEIFEVEVAPHSMPVHLGHMNYAPNDISRAIDRWHHDTLPLDYVMMVTDPADFSGGRFEYFLGTKWEAAKLAEAGETPPTDRIVTPEIKGPGYAVALHGDMIVHRAGVLNEQAERITMVNGYVATDPTLNLHEQQRTRDLVSVDDPLCLYTEWAKQAAWQSQAKLDLLIKDLPFTDDREVVIQALESAIEEITQTIEDMRTADGNLTHYGG